jgi:PIN domain nuclease of toxin-antitoxin system
LKLLLDTHVLLWWFSDDDRLGMPVRGLIGDPDTDVLVSVVSLWEIAVKMRIGKLNVDLKDMLAAIALDSFLVLDIRPAHLLQLAGLPTLHRDPFDHLLTAQAIVENAVFVSEDRNIARYPARSMRCSAGIAPG